MVYTSVNNSSKDLKPPVISLNLNSDNICFILYFNMALISPPTLSNLGGEAFMWRDSLNSMKTSIAKVFYRSGVK